MHIQVIHREPPRWQKLLCPPCAVQHVEGCSPAAKLLWASCLCWPLNGLACAAYYTTQPAIRVEHHTGVQQGWIYPPPSGATQRFPAL